MVSRIFIAEIVKHLAPNIHRVFDMKRLSLEASSAIFSRMKACSYCGRENADDAQNCRECGTEFPAAQTQESSREKTEETERPLSDLSELDMGFEVVEGFSRPNWKMIYESVKGRVPEDDLSAMWNYIVTKWLEELSADLGGDSRVRWSDNFYCLSDLGADATHALLTHAEFVVETIRGCLGKAAWSGYHGKHVLLLFSDPDDYYAYVSYHHREGTHILSGGVFIRRGYAHIALPYVNTLSAQHVLVHELTHNLLCHLRIPLWLNEGLAVVIEGLVARRGFIMSRELAERHNNHWNDTNIQIFWAGKTFDMPGDDSELSYSLGEVLVRLLSEKGADFIEFVKAADWRDGGQDAAINFLGQGLEEFLGGFLGPGNWRPQRKAIAENLKTNGQQHCPILPHL
jgi:ribosomal protein L40E